tara:strand:- start:21538 stop:21948 length:411 start_codon:yes stop_codon:yes gene_type:complete
MKKVSLTLRRRLIVQRKQMLHSDGTFTRTEMLEAATAACQLREPDAIDRVLLHRWWLKNWDSHPRLAASFATYRAEGRASLTAQLHEAKPPTWGDIDWLGEAWATIQLHDCFEVSLPQAVASVESIGRLVDAGVNA